ncbi:MAG: flagellar hook-associated protein FlgK [Deferribacterales bacterium]
MSNLLTMLSTGVSGLFATQAQINVSGNNITNIDTEGYTRQRVALSTSLSQVTSKGVFGTGVTIEDVTQVYDSLLAATLRTESSDLYYYSTMQDELEAVEIYFNELEDGSGLGEAMANYFDAWSDLANTATDESDEAEIKKQTVVETAAILAEKLRASYGELEELQSSCNDQVGAYVDRINEISQNIAYLNGEIAAIEVTGITANDLRDNRENLLDELAQYTNFNSSEDANGQISVFINGHTLVDDGQSFTLSAAQTSGEDNTYSIYWNTSDTRTEGVDITSSFKSGVIGAYIDLRDDVLQGYMDSLNELASVLITSTNELHSVGQGTEQLTQVTSSNGVPNATYALNSAAGTFGTSTITNGVMRISVYDSEGNLVDNLDIEVDPDTDSLKSIIDKISDADGNPNGGLIQASLSEDNTIKITSESGYTFTFSEDTSGFLVASGTYGFFTGKNASDIDVSALVKNNISYLATSTTGAVGDNSNAANIADLKSESLFSGSSVTLDGFYALFVSAIATDKSTADVYTATKQNAVDEYELKLESISGVSLDEELTNIMRFQRAYEASARFITVIDEMLDKMVNGLGTGGR